MVEVVMIDQSNLMPSVDNTVIQVSENTEEIRNRSYKKIHVNKDKESSVEKANDDDVHLPVTEIHLKSHEWFGDFVTKHEIPRKVFHSSIGFITLYLYTQGIDYKKVALPLIIAFTIIFILDVIRLHWPYFNKLYLSLIHIYVYKRQIVQCVRNTDNDCTIQD